MLAALLIFHGTVYVVRMNGFYVWKIIFGEFVFNYKERNQEHLVERKHNVRIRKETNMGVFRLVEKERSRKKREYYD